jgi:Uma2 family endonuclease
MAWVEAPARPPFTRGRRIYVTAPKPLAFPSEEPPEEHVSETKRHLEARTALYLLLKDALPGAAIGSDQFVYSDASDPRKCLSPDAFVKLGAALPSFDSWKVWERGAPDLAVEIVSASDRSDADWAVKLDRYQASGIGEVVRFDPEDGAQPLRVWDRVDGDLIERAPESQDRYECEALRLWWTIVPSAYGPMLRLCRDRVGTDILPTPDEERVRLTQALAEERKARAAAEHERLLAQHERQRAEDERQRAEDERKRAEDKLLAAEVASRRAEDRLLASEREIVELRAELARARGPGRDPQ